jgi:hypothetical protein
MECFLFPVWTGGVRRSEVRFVCECSLSLSVDEHPTALQATGFGLFHKCEEIEYIIQASVL